jgi:leucyl/phenylalanyl-tRNA--protein transferase
MPSLDPETLLAGYAQGVFPMADRHGRIQFYTADPRGVLPLDGFHVPRTLRQLERREPPAFEVRLRQHYG